MTQWKQNIMSANFIMMMYTSKQLYRSNQNNSLTPLITVIISKSFKQWSLWIWTIKIRKSNQWYNGNIILWVRLLLWWCNDRKYLSCRIKKYFTYHFVPLDHSKIWVNNEAYHLKRSTGNIYLYNKGKKYYEYNFIINMYTSKNCTSWIKNNSLTTLFTVIVSDHLNN